MHVVPRSIGGAWSAWQAVNCYPEPKRSDLDALCRAVRVLRAMFGLTWSAELWRSCGVLLASAVGRRYIVVLWLRRQAVLGRRKEFF